MIRSKLLIVIGLGIALAAAIAIMVLPRGTLEARESDRAVAPTTLDQPLDAPEAQAAATTPLILQYAAKFVCMEPLQPGAYSYGVAAPLIKESTGILLHNPNTFTVTLYKKATLALAEELPPAQPGKWKPYTLGPDRAFRIDCDDIAKLLTGNPAATFIGTYGIGVEVEGYVVIAIGPQTVAGANLPLRYSPLDVTSEYVRGSEVLKKDINYQPWWRWWWWPLPWRLGYPYDRLLPIQNLSANVDCRGLLYTALQQDAQAIADPQQRTLTLAALDVGSSLDPTNIQNLTDSTPPALVALVGRCNKIYAGTAWVAEIDYALVSNKTCTDADPRTPGTPGQCGPNLTTNVVYPWWPGRWYDLAVVMPQNKSTDIDAYFRQWHTQQWINAGTPAATVSAAMVYWFPYWCGWGYWWWWWNAGDCTSIGVGQGESLDVQQVTPTRVFMNVWPPQPQ